MPNDPVRVRFAPSPTGPLHIGGVRTALYNYLFAKKMGGQFLLRIEDTDQKRYVDGAEEYIVKSLEWLGLWPDEGPGIGGDYGPYKQSERSALYLEHIEKLLASGHAYYAFDTPEELNAQREKDPNWTYNASQRKGMRNSVSLPEEETKALLEKREPYVVRIKIPTEREVVVDDVIRGKVVFNSKEIDDKVLMKQDGLPTYHLANVIDDHHMKITHVIRGEEWLSSAALHVLLYESFGWEAPNWVHLPLILKPEGKGKLSKRDGEKGGFPVFPLNWNDPMSGEEIIGYKESGYFPEAVVNMLALLGWNPGTEQEIFSLEELTKHFSLERINRSGARFDPEKSKWFNQEYLRQKNNDELADLLLPFLNEKGFEADKNLSLKIVELMKERANFVRDMSEVDLLFHRPEKFDEKTHRKKWKENTAQILKDYSNSVRSAEKFNAEQIEIDFKAFLEKNELGMGALMPNLRLVLTGIGSGPSLYHIMEILGKEECLARTEKGISKLS
ncbi:MAG: glutamate--tRNA ligase [Flavobacteriales bacterium]|nr:glutamate--tRNA ligase [Flavobacteriales bacterium]